MGHDWVFAVLHDLKAYALANGFVGLAGKVDEALAVATQELGPRSGAMSGKLPDGGMTH